MEQTSQPSKAPVVPLTEYLRPELPEAALYGLLGDIARVLSMRTGADPAAILLQTIVMLGNVVGPQPHISFGGADHAARLFVLLCGEAATGLKGTSLAAVERLFAEACPDWYDTRVLRGLQSPEAMVDRVADAPAGDSRLLVLEPEYGRLLGRLMAAHGFSAQLRNAWDGAPLEIARTRRGGKRDSVRASFPHISLIAHVTPQELAHFRNRVRLTDGLGSRFLHAIVTGAARRANPWASDRDEKEIELVARIRDAIDYSRNGVLEHTDPISRELCLLRGVQPRREMAVAIAIRQRRLLVPSASDYTSDLEALTRRGPVQTVRLALAYAIAEQAGALLPVHLDAAEALWRFCAAASQAIYGAPIGQLAPRADPKNVGKLLEYLHERGSWVSRSEVNKALFKRNASSSEINAIVEALQLRVAVEVRSIGTTGGRPRTEYRLAPRQSGLFR
jgi:hypothetical protein